MALSWLHLVRAPTLFIVGQHDDDGRDRSAEACRRIPGQRALVLIPGAGHLFVNNDVLEEAADHARRWFERYLGASGPERAAAA
jgi:pimeloyl-ACP methyl ester carboxylesterase